MNKYHLKYVAGEVQKGTGKMVYGKGQQAKGLQKPVSCCGRLKIDQGV